MRLPDIGADAYLVQSLYDLGAYTQDGMGNIVAQSWVEVQAFCRLSDLIKTNKEARLLRELSQAWCYGHSTGCNPLGIEPMDQ